MNMKRLIREVVPTFTQEQADAFTPSIYPESLPYILSSVVPVDGVGTFPRPIRKYYINTDGSDDKTGGSLQIYQGGYIYPYWGVDTLFAHVEVVFDEIPIPHESILKWCALALKGGPISSSARANQLVVVEGNHLHYLWRVLSLEAEAALTDSSRSLDITNLHLWRKQLPNRWVCGRVSLDIQDAPLEGGSLLDIPGPSYILTTSRGTRPIDWDHHTASVPDSEPIHKLYMSLLGENLL